MKKPFIIGITGGIGSGKSTLSNMLRERLFKVYDTDARARFLQDESLPLRKKIAELFGEEIYTEKGLDRLKLGKIVFVDKTLLAKLSAVVHPAVCEDFELWKKENKEDSFLFVECAILFESSLVELVDKVILVTAPEDIRINRVLKRDGVSIEQVRARMKFQMPEEDKKKRSDIILDSSGHNALKNNIERVIIELDKLRENEEEV